MNAKRQFLQTAVRGAAALFASSAVGHSSLNRVWSGQAVSTAPSPLGPSNTAVDSVYREINKLYEKKHRFSNALAAPDADLLNLGSVTPSWRAIKTMQRNDDRESLISALYKKIEALTVNPLQAIGQEIKKAVLE